MGIRRRALGRAVAAGVILIPAVLASACGSTDEHAAPDRVPGFAVEQTTFAPPPVAVPAPAIPTPAALTALFNAALDYDIRVEDRVKLFQGVRADDLQFAQQFVQEGMAVDFTSVTEFAEGSIGATGRVIYKGRVSPTDAGPIPFVSENGVWKISKRWVCSLTGTC